MINPLLSSTRIVTLTIISFPKKNKLLLGTMLLLRQIDDKPGKKFAINDSINLMDCPAVPANQEYQEYFLCLKVFTHTESGVDRPNKNVLGAD